MIELKCEGCGTTASDNVEERSAYHTIRVDRDIRVDFCGTCTNTLFTVFPAMRSNMAGLSRKPRRRRGFGAMSKSLQRKIARLGGMAAHAKGTAHEFSKKEAAAAGSIGGNVSRRLR